MDIMRQLIAVALLAGLAGGVSVAAQPPAARSVLLVVDDLHTDFGVTPRLRQLLDTTVKILVASGVRCGIASSSGKLAFVEPTTNVDTIEAVIARATGAALKPSEVALLASQQQAAREVQYRAQSAFTQVSRAVNTVAAARAGQTFDVLYFSSGYDERLVSPPDELVATAIRARAPIHTIDLVDLADRPGVPQRPDVLAAHRAGPHQSLSTMAARTRGVAVASDGEFTDLVGRLASAAR
jgi:hypothetical protein